MGEELEYDFPFLTSCFGLRVQSSPRVTNARIFSLFFSIVSFIIPVIFRPYLKLALTYSIIIGSIPLAIKLLLYIISRLIDKTFDLSSSDDEEIEVTHERPINISPTLWSHAAEFSPENPFTDEHAVNYIGLGFKPEEVYEFAHKIKESNYDLETKTTKIATKKKTYINLFGKLKGFAIKRESIENVFTNNCSLLYVIIGGILIYLSYFLCFYVNHTFTNTTKWFYTIELGISIHLFLVPPDVEPYSVTKGDIFNGITRLFTTVICFSALYGCNLVKNEKIYFKDFNFTIKIGIIYKIVNIITFISVGLNFLAIHFYITSPLNFIPYFLENFNTYVFGCSLSKSFLHAIILFIRGIVCVIIFYFLDSKYLAIKMLSIPAITLIVQVPMIWTPLFRAKLFWNFFIIFGFCLLHYTLTFIVIYTEKCIDIISMTLSVISLLLEFFIPKLITYRMFDCYTTKFIEGNIKICTILRYIIPHLISPIIVSQIIKYNDKSRLLFSITCVCALTKSFTDPHTFSLAIFLYSFLFYFDFPMKSKTLTLFLSLLIARKYFSVKPTVELQHMPKANEHFIFTYFVSSDEMFKIPILLFNSIFGNLFIDIFSLNSFRIVSSFKPSCFWDQWNEQEDEKLFEADLTEHPLETPVYISLSNYLEKNLGKFVSSGKLGTVDSNDIFILTDKDLIAIIEIISRESYSVHFRLRGLEFNDVSPCHLNNRNIISDDLSMILQTESFKKNVINSLKLSRGPHHLIQSDLFFPVRSLALYDISAFFSSVNEQTKENLKYVVLVIVLKESNIFDNSEEYAFVPNNDDKFCFYLSKFGLILSENDFEIANCIRYSILTALGINKSPNNQLYNLFGLLNNPQKYEIEVNDYDIGKIRSILVNFTRKYIASLIFATVHSCSDIDWSNPDVDLLIDFYNQAVYQFCPLPLSSYEFKNAFLNKKEVIVTYSKNNPDKFGIYMCSEENSWNFIKYNQLQAHCLWNYFAIMQLYYRCDDPESKIYRDTQCHMRNLFYTSASHPLGYPVYVSPILTSYYLPTFL